MPSSVFMRPRARAAMSSVSQQQVFREVHTEDELRAAVYSENSDTYLFGVTGRRIVIASPISVKSPIKITAHGTIIESHGRIPIFPIADSIDCVFDATSAVNVVIRDLLFSNASGVIDPSSAIKLGGISSVTNCVFTTGTSTISVGTDCIVSGNMIFSGTFSGATAGILLTGSNSIVTSNMITGGILSESASSKCSISSNVLFGTNINTSASLLGQNSIVGNTNVGTITNSATDAVTSNT